MKLAPPSEPTLRLSTADMMAAIQAMDPEAKKELDELAKLGDKFPAHAEAEKLRQSL